MVRAFHLLCEVYTCLSWGVYKSSFLMFSYKIIDTLPYVLGNGQTSRRDKSRHD